MRKSTAFERLETRNVRAEVGRSGNRINFVATFGGAKHVYDNQTLMLEKSTYYILDAQGNQLSMYEHSVDDADVKYYLTERNIYGSSRLGTLKDPVNMLNAEPLQSYGILGNRNYELSNHLGNVLTVISDIKYPLSSDNTTIDGYEVGISNVFDYSPFGAPLDGRTIQNIFHQEEITDTSTVLKTIYVLEEMFETASDWEAVTSYSQITYPSGKMRVASSSSSVKRIGAKKGFTTGTGQHTVSFEMASLPSGVCAGLPGGGVVMGAQHNETSDTLAGTGSYQIQSTSPHYVVVEIRNENNALVLKDSTNSTGTYSYAFSAPQGKEYTVSFHNKSMCANLGYQIDNVFISYDTLEVVTGNAIIVTDTLFIINNDFENPVTEPNGAGIKIDGWAHYSPSTTLSVEPHNGSDWLKVVSTNGTHGAHQGFSVEPGETYTFEIDLHRPAGMNKEINVVIWKNTGPSGALSIHVLNTDGFNTFNYTATSSNIYIQIRQAGTYYLDNIKMYRTYQDTVFVGGFDVDMAYAYGFNGMLKDNEIKGKGNSYDFGARLYDSRLGRWLALDALSQKFPSESHYSSFRNSPILYVDKDGNEWVNAHTAKRKELEKQALNNPNNRSIKRALRNEIEKETKVNMYLKTLEENDVSLYNYINNLQVEGKEGKINVKVKVSVDDWNSDKSQSAETKFRNTGPYVAYDNLEDIFSGGRAPINEDGEIGFDIILNGMFSYHDESLSNEAGDVMFRMEYPEASRRSGSDVGKTESEYLKSGSAGDYSNRVQELYRERKKTGEGKDETNNPYPIENKNE